MRHQINNKADKLETYPTAEINVALGILQAGIHRKVGITVVDIDGKFKIMVCQMIYLKFKKWMVQQYTMI